MFALLPSDGVYEGVGMTFANSGLTKYESVYFPSRLSEQHARRVDDE